jgi:hypothetical protein
LFGILPPGVRDRDCSFSHCSSESDRINHLQNKKKEKKKENRAYQKKEKEREKEQLQL